MVDNKSCVFDTLRAATFNHPVKRFACTTCDEHLFLAEAVYVAKPKFQKYVQESRPILKFP